MKAAIFAGEAGWRALNAKYAGLVKPAITFFGENLPKRFVSCAKTDFPKCELLLIFGTSLMVQPFASLVRFPPRGTPRILINRERRGQEMGLDFDSPGRTDGLFLGDCDAGAEGLARHLGWSLDATQASSTDVSDQPSEAARRVRIGVTRSATSNQPESVIVVAPAYESIVAAAANKLKMPPKSIKRLVLRASCRGYAAGTELPRGDCSTVLADDALLWVSTTAAAAGEALPEVA